MALDRWIALVILLIALAYGYAAFFTMDANLPPIMQRQAVKPSTFPKVLSVLTMVLALFILLGGERSDGPKEGEIDYRRLGDYKLGQAMMLLGLMVVYALALRPLGFLMSTALFLSIGAAILGERRWITMVVTSVIAAFVVWFLVEILLDIFLRPFPFVFREAGNAFTEAVETRWEAFTDLFRSDDVEVTE